VDPIVLVAALFALVLGGGLGYFAVQTAAHSVLDLAQEKRKAILAGAESEAKAHRADTELEAQRAAEKTRTELEAEARRRRADLDKEESRLGHREDRMDRRQEDLEELERGIRLHQKELDKLRAEALELTEQKRSELEKVSSLTREEARDLLLKKLEDDLEHDLARRIQENESSIREQSKRKAVAVLSEAVQKCASDFTAERLVTVVSLPNDEMKGRIIGRDGRNIRAFESLTGVDVIIDDTPEAVVLSAFNSVKREIARLSLEKLIADGRIHPAKIEQVFEQTQHELFEQIRETGSQAITKLGLTGVNDRLVFEIGKMRYRASYGQNLLEHSFEVAHLAETLALEIGADAAMTKRAAFFHDLGKVADDLREEGNHAILGMKIAKRLGESERVCNAIGAHHEDIPFQTPEAVLVQVADMLSAARPGARRETTSSYVKRIENLESIAQDFRGVAYAYAIQAGREVRVVVRPSDVDDLSSQKLARDIRRRIESDMEFPGQVKVVVIRETRSIEVAR
jgi:ribonuclease Y